MIYKLMTYNIQHGLDYKARLSGQRQVNFQGLKDVIDIVKPDILNVNEIYGSGIDCNSKEYFDQVSYIANICSFPYAFFSKAINAKNGEYGNAIFSKIPFLGKEIVHITDPCPNLESKLLYESRVITKFDFGTFDLITTHIGLNDEEKENAYVSLMNIINPNKKTILLGDFNMNIDNRLIQKILNKYKEVTIEAKEKVINTYPSITPYSKIDYIFVSKEIEIIDADVIDCTNSDHLPLYAIISL